MFDHAAFREYMKTLAIRHRYINHTEAEPRFFELGLSEILNGNLPSIPADAFIMILEGTDSALSGDDIDFPIRLRKGAFIILRHAEIVNFTDIGNAYRECEEIGDEVVRRMYLDSQLALHKNPDVIPEAEAIMGFNPDRIDTQITMGLLTGSYYGQRYEFEVQHGFDLITINEDQWQ